MAASNSAGAETRKLCPFKHKCYRMNPIHFREMAHPHLEELLVDQLDNTITIPAHLDFECSDREKLLNQLTILKTILKKEREKNEAIRAVIKNESINHSRITGISNSQEPKSTLSQDFKEKIERNKKAAMIRRERKLNKMDEEATVVASTITTSLGQREETSLNDNGKRKAEGSLKVIKKYLDNNSDEKEKIKTVTTAVVESKFVNEGNAKETWSNNLTVITDSSNFSTAITSVRKQQIGYFNDNKNTKMGTSSKVNQSSGSSSIAATSVLDYYQTCSRDTMKERARDKAIEMMKMQNLKVSLAQRGEFALKYALAAPYYVFFTRVEQLEQTHKQNISVTFPEILDKSLGDIEASLHINFMVDVGWLCLQYLLAGQRNDMLLMIGERCDSGSLPNITTVIVKMPTPFSTHHSKVSILKYVDGGIRIIISTANLYSDDWENRTQGMWISPHLPQLEDGINPSDGESLTGFKKDFEKYLLTYNNSALDKWIQIVRRADFTNVNVFFVGSVPGSHKDAEMHNWGHRKLAKILSQHATLPANAPQWPIVAQSSSIGSLGANYNAWLSTVIIPSMSMEKNKGMKSQPNFQFIYPSINNYKKSFDCRVASCCLPYSMKTHSKQTWLEDYLYEWKADDYARTRAMPHIKSYTRISPNLDEIPWFVLTSANLSKAAWGSGKTSHYVCNYEAGVIFIPQFVINATTFPIKNQKSENVPVFPISYDLPLTKYRAQEKPFVVEFFNDV